MKKTILALLSLSLVLGMMTGCGNNDSSKKTGTDSAVSQSGGELSSEEKKQAVEEPDIMGFFTGDSKTEFIGMTAEEFEKETGSSIVKDNALEYTEDDGMIFAKYSLGSKDSMLGGRVKLAKAYDQTLATSFKDGKLKVLSVRISKITKDEAITICDDFIKAFEGKLPEGYVRFPDSERGKDVEVGFTKGVEDYCISMTRSEDFDGDYGISFDLQNYAERYGMTQDQIDMLKE
ncbi:MAG: hypothetical protein IJ740_11525 [Ruminococcus sp.]|nr:hypothetical protein [Ruminococcus sp.]